MKCVAELELLGAAVGEVGAEVLGYPSSVSHLSV